MASSLSKAFEEALAARKEPVLCWVGKKQDKWSTHLTYYWDGKTLTDLRPHAQKPPSDDKGPSSNSPQNVLHSPENEQT